MFLAIFLMQNFRRFLRSAFLMALLFLLAACGSTVTLPAQQQAVAIDKSFQGQVTPLPGVPGYRCGAWTSNNAPSSYGTITIYARLTKNLAGVAGAFATAVTHFRAVDVTLNQLPVSDSGGYVSFTLALQGRQPWRVPATVDVSFTVSGKAIECSSAFFTPL